MADTTVEVVMDNVVIDVPVVDASVLEDSKVEVVKIEKIEPGIIEIEVANSQNSNLFILSDNQVDCINESPPVGECVVSASGSSEPLPLQTNTSIQVIDHTNASETAASKGPPVQTTNDAGSFQPLGSSTPVVLMDNPLYKQRNKLLTSSILSTADIAKEIHERAEKKRPQQLPEGGDLIFQKQLTKRLAEKVVKEDTLNHSITVQMFTPPPAPKLPKIDSDQPDLDARRLLQILEEGAESQYPEPAKPPKIPKLVKSEIDRELEKKIALKQLMEVSRKRKPRENNNNDNSSKSDSKPRKRLKNEVQRLLQDEGAINMLYAMEKGEDSKATALPSKRRMKRALMKKAQEVSQAIMGGSALNKGLRLRHPTDQKTKKDVEDLADSKNKSDLQDKDSKSEFTAPSPTMGASKIIRRHSSSSSYSGNNSPIRRISLDEGLKSDGEKEKKIVENGISHSSPSNKNQAQTNKSIKNKGKNAKLIKKSLNNSLKKKNLDNSKGKVVKVLKNKKEVTEKSPKGSDVEKSDENNKNTPPIKQSKSDIKTEENKSDQVAPVETSVQNSNKATDQNGFKEKLQMEFTNKLKTMMVRQGLLSKDDNKRVALSSTPTTSKVPTAKPAIPDKQMLTENKSLTCEAIWQMLQDDWNTGDDPDDPPSPYECPSPQHSPSASLIEMDSKTFSTPLSKEIAPLPASEPGANEVNDDFYSSCDDVYLSPSYSSASSVSSSSSFYKSLSVSSDPSKNDLKLDSIPENKNEVPFSHQLGSSTYMYKELMLRRIGPLTHVNIAPVSTHLPQAFNVQVLKELCSVLESCGTDTRCKCLLLTSSGSLFSSGVDLPCLLSEVPQVRSNAAKAMALAVKEFAHKLGMFSKMVVAGVSGPCVGLGVAMLPLCDIVLSSPRSVFLTPYSSLGYIPEAAATLTLPAIIGHRMASSMLIGGRKLLAQEAVNCGLVSQVLGEENFACQVLETAFSIATSSTQSMESTKALMMHTVRSRLMTVLATEAALLQQHWLTHDCQMRIKEKAEKLLNE